VHDDSRRDGKKKAAFGRSKSPAFAGTKTAARVIPIIMQGITPMG